MEPFQVNPLSQAVAMELVERCRSQEAGVVSIRAEDVLAAIDIHRLSQFSFWDALVVQAAFQSDCSVLYSEDLQHGRRINGLEIVNPFQ